MHRTLSEPAALLALALLNLADDEGRFEADAEAIKARLFTYRKLTVDIETCLGELAQKPIEFIVLYEAEVGGEKLRLGQVVNFRRHQVINKPKRSTLPPPPSDSYRNDTGGLRDVSEHVDETDTGGVTPSMEGRKEGKGRNEGGTHTLARAEDDASIPSLAEVLTFCAGPAGIPENYGRDFWARHQEKPQEMWFQKTGGLVVWRQRIVNWWAKDRHTWTAEGSKRSENSKTGAAREERRGREFQENLSAPAK